MADYNVNMKQWNGTSFDNVLPLAYLANNASKLEGKTYSEILSAANRYSDGFCKINKGSYVGTGTYGTDNPTTITFPSLPKLVLITNDKEFPRTSDYTLDYHLSIITPEMKTILNCDGSISTVSWVNNTLKLVTASTSNPHTHQNNTKGYTYTWTAFL